VDLEVFTWVMLENLCTVQ